MRISPWRKKNLNLDSFSLVMITFIGRKQRACFIFSLMLFFIFVSPVLCRENAVRVITTLEPYREFIEQIGGEHVEVTVLIPSGFSPHSYEPSPDTLVTISRAELYVRVGSGIEFEILWADAVRDMNKDMYLCDSSSGIPFISMNNEYGEDPHVWLSPKNVLIIIRNVRDALSAIRPDLSAAFISGADTYASLLEGLDADIAAVLASRSPRSFMVFHPSWEYFARDYNLVQVPIEVEGREPSPRHIAKIIRIAREKKIKTVFTSPHVSQKTAEIIAREINGSVATADPLAPDYLQNMRRVAASLAEHDE